MFRTLMKSKIHRATITQCDLHYVGSITVDQDLLDATNLISGEQVHVVDITNGARLVTYVIAGPRGSGVIGVNGAAARLVQAGDLVILIAYANVHNDESSEFEPKVAFVDEANRVIDLGSDPASAPEGHGLTPGDVLVTASEH